ncbi:MAG TPA: septation protein A [Chromatiales bacterium]|nr:septation protein A [Chromatiales bacterium]
MKILYDFFPVLLFFASYKLFPMLEPETAREILAWLPGGDGTGGAAEAIYPATAVAILASLLQLAIGWLRHRRLERSHILSGALITVFGGATLLLHDPNFIKWKPTVLNWVFAAAFLTTQFVGGRPLVARLMDHALQVPEPVWYRVNRWWVLFFVFSGAANLFVAYRFSEGVWVNFKLFGLLGFTFVFVLLQAFYLARFVQEPETSPAD